MASESGEKNAKKRRIVFKLKDRVSSFLEEDQRSPSGKYARWRARLLSMGLKCVYISPMSNAKEPLKVTPRHASVPKILKCTKDAVEYSSALYSGPTLEALREGELFDCGVMPWPNAPIVPHSGGVIHPLFVGDPDLLSGEPCDFLKEDPRAKASGERRFMWVYSCANEIFFRKGGHFAFGRDAAIVVLTHRMWAAGSRGVGARLAAEFGVRDLVTSYEFWIRPQAAAAATTLGPEFYTVCGILESLRLAPCLMYNCASTFRSVAARVEERDEEAMAGFFAEQAGLWRDTFGNAMMSTDATNTKQFEFFESLEDVHRSLEESKYAEVEGVGALGLHKTLVIISSNSRELPADVSYEASGLFLSVPPGDRVHVVHRRDLERHVRETRFFLRLFTRAKLTREQLDEAQTEAMEALLGNLKRMDLMDVSGSRPGGGGGGAAEAEAPWTADEILDMYYAARVRVSRDPVARRILGSRVVSPRLLREMMEAVEAYDTLETDEDAEFYNPRHPVLSLEQVTNRDLMRRVRARLEELRSDQILNTPLFYEWDRVVCEDQTYEPRVFSSKQFWTNRGYSSLWAISRDIRRRTLATSLAPPRQLHTAVSRACVRVDRSVCFVANHLVHCLNPGVSAARIYGYLKSAIPYRSLTPAWWSRNSMTEKVTLVQPRTYDSFEEAAADVRANFEACIGAVERGTASLESHLEHLTSFERWVSEATKARARYVQTGGRCSEPFVGDDFSLFDAVAAFGGGEGGEGGAALFGPGFLASADPSVKVRIHITQEATGGVLVSIGDFEPPPTLAGAAPLPSESESQKIARKLSGIRSAEAVLDYYPQEMMRSSSILDKASIFLRESRNAFERVKSKTEEFLRQLRGGEEDEDEILCEACFSERGCVLTAWGDVFCEVCGSCPKCPKSRNALGSLNVVMFDRFLRGGDSGSGSGSGSGGSGSPEGSGSGSGSGSPSGSESGSESGSGSAPVHSNFQEAFVREIRSIRDSLGGLGIMFVTDSPESIQDLLCDEFRDIWMKAYYPPSEKRAPIPPGSSIKNTCWTLSVKELVSQLHRVSGPTPVKDRQKTVSGLLGPSPPQVGAIVVCDMDINDDAVLSILAEVRSICTSCSVPLYCVNVPGATLTEYLWDFFSKPQARQRKSMIEEADTAQPTNFDLFDMEDEEFVRKTLLCPFLFRGVMSMQEWSTMNESIDSRRRHAADQGEADGEQQHQNAVVPRILRDEDEDSQEEEEEEEYSEGEDD